MTPLATSSRAFERRVTFRLWDTGLAVDVIREPAHGGVVIIKQVGDEFGVVCRTNRPKDRWDAGAYVLLLERWIPSSAARDRADWPSPGPIERVELFRRACAAVARAAKCTAGMSSTWRGECPHDFGPDGLERP